MLNKDSGVGLALAVLLKRAASDWRTVLWIIGGLSLAVVPAWFFVFHESSPLSLRAPSQSLAAPAAFQPAAADILPGRTAVAPAANAPLKPARSVAEAERSRALAPAKSAATRGPGPGSASALGEPGVAQDGGEGTRYQPPGRSGSLPAMRSDASAFTGRPVSVPLTAFSRQNKASREQLSERETLRDEPQVKMPGRAAASRGAHTEAASGPSQPPASAAGTASGQPVLETPGQTGIQAAQGGGLAAASASGSGASAGGSDSLSLAGLTGGAAAAAAAAGGGGAGMSAGDAAGMTQATMASSRKCAETTQYYTPLVQKASQEMLALNSQAISCGPTIKCSFASNSVCADATDASLSWWKRYYAAMCACARVHCQVGAKCQEINSLNCQQLHACPITATQPCQSSPCDY